MKDDRSVKSTHSRRSTFPNMENDSLNLNGLTGNKITSPKTTKKPKMWKVYAVDEHLPKEKEEEEDKELRPDEVIEIALENQRRQSAPERSAPHQITFGSAQMEGLPVKERRSSAPNTVKKNVTKEENKQRVQSNSGDQPKPIRQQRFSAKGKRKTSQPAADVLSTIQIIEDTNAKQRKSIDEAEEEEAERVRMQDKFARQLRKALLKLQEERKGGGGGGASNKQHAKGASPRNSQAQLHHPTPADAEQPWWQASQIETTFSTQNLRFSVSCNSNMTSINNFTTARTLNFLSSLDSARDRLLLRPSSSWPTFHNDLNWTNFPMAMLKVDRMCDPLSKWAAEEMHMPPPYLFRGLNIRYHRPWSALDVYRSTFAPDEKVELEKQEKRVKIFKLLNDEKIRKNFNRILTDQHINQSAQPSLVDTSNPHFYGVKTSAVKRKTVSQIDLKKITKKDERRSSAQEVLRSGKRR